MSLQQSRKKIFRMCLIGYEIRMSIGDTVRIANRIITGIKCGNFLEMGLLGS